MTVAGFSEHESPTRDRFNDWSRSPAFRRLRPWLANVQVNVLGQLDWSFVRTFLDVACGRGWAVYEAAFRLQSKEDGLACGCDISEGMLRQRIVPDPCPPNATFLVASGQALPYRGDSFDAIICTAAFHHLPFPAESLAEFRRVLRPGGKVVIAEGCRNQSIGTWMWDRLHRWFEPGHVKYYRTDELLALMNDAGFAGVELKEFYPPYAKTKKLIGNFALCTGIEPGRG